VNIGHVTDACAYPLGDAVRHCRALIHPKCSQHRERRTRNGVVTSMSDERPILEVRQSAWQMSSLRDHRLRIFGDRVELVRPRVMGEARTTAISLSDIDYISTKDFLLVWSDLLIVPKNGAAIRLRPIGKGEAEHVETLIQRQSKKREP
jgi:hypothetical protein